MALTVISAPCTLIVMQGLCCFIGAAGSQQMSTAASIVGSRGHQHLSNFNLAFRRRAQLVHSCRLLGCFKVQQRTRVLASSHVMLAGPSNYRLLTADVQ